MRKVLTCKIITVFLTGFSTQILADDLSDSNQLFDWAQTTFFEYFSPSNQETFQELGYIARHFEGTDTYLGTKEGRVYILGDVFGGLQDVGSLNGFLDMINNKPLNDTGIIWGANSSTTNNLTCTGIIIDAQDCSQGRDVTHNDASDGHAGFSFTKLDNNGNALAASAAAWNCVQDNVTGLVWEIKTTQGGVHDKDNTYRWGGITTPGDGTIGTHYSDWNSLVNESNSENLCGFSDWHVPTVVELISIIHYGELNIAVDADYFPYVSEYVWSSTPNAQEPGAYNVAWAIHFKFAQAVTTGRVNENQVMLVRGH